MGAQMSIVEKHGQLQVVGNKVVDKQLWQNFRLWAAC